MTIKNITKQMTMLLPKWMEIRKNTNSKGAQTLDTVGIQMEDLQMLMTSFMSSLYIDTAGDSSQYDILNIDYLYKIYLGDAVTDFSYLDVKYRTNIDPLVFDSMERAENLFDFYRINENTFYLNLEENTIYLKPGSSNVRDMSNKDIAIMVNGAMFEKDTMTLHHVWGPLDEFGLLVSCPRIYGERNIEYKERLLDVFKNKGNATREGLNNYLSRSLTLTEEEAQVVRSMEDEDYINSMIEEDGTLSEKLKEFIKISDRVNRFSSDNYWSILEENSVGLKYIPIQWKNGLEEWDISRIQNGVGDTNDLLVRKPGIESSIQEFDYEIFAEGLAYPDKIIYPEQTFKYKIYSDGYKYESGYSPEEFYYTVVASELIPIEAEIEARSEYTHDYDLDLAGYSVSADIIGEENYYEDNYVVSNNLLVTSGQYFPNKYKRYMEVAAKFYTNESNSSTPSLENITIKYTKGGTQNTIRFEGVTGTNYSETIKTFVAGFEAVDNWDDTSIVGERFRQDTNDSYRVEANIDNSVTLTKGGYQKIYDSPGDWDDGIKNKDTVNVKISSSGNLRLSI